jgi:hypothetical protein
MTSLELKLPHCVGGDSYSWKAQGDNDKGTSFGATRRDGGGASKAIRCHLEKGGQGRAIRVRSSVSSAERLPSISGIETHKLSKASQSRLSKAQYHPPKRDERDVPDTYCDHLDLKLSSYLR